MPEQTLTVEVYPDPEAIATGTPQVYREVDFVSFVNDGTFGPPALVAPSAKNPDGKPIARPGQRVLYVNTSLIPLFTIERNGDEA